MASDGKTTTATSTPHRGIRIFTYPKTIFLWPTMVAALISAIIMVITHDDVTDPRKESHAAAASAAAAQPARGADADTITVTLKRRFTSPQNLAGTLFITVFFLNLVVLSIDFPRFTIVALILGAAALVFLLLYLNVYFNVLPPLVAFLEHIFMIANATFYFMIAGAVLVVLGIIWLTRYLDYWVILPNEILHNHGPFSDLERFPTTNLKFDKEIPDILEYALLGSGRLVLHIFGHPKAYVLDNVLWIDSKEAELKQIMSRLEVRITTDQETVPGG